MADASRDVSVPGQPPVVIEVTERAQDSSTAAKDANFPLLQFGELAVQQPPRAP